MADTFQTTIDISRKGFSNLQQAAELLEIMYQGRGDGNGLLNALASANSADVIKALAPIVAPMPDPPSAGRTVNIRFYDIPDVQKAMEKIARACGCVPAKGPYAGLGLGSLSLLARKLGEVEPEVLASALEDVIEMEGE